MRYTKEHEWLKPDGDYFLVGISEHAAELLGDIVFVDLPQEGDKVEAHDEIAVVESVKAASDVYCPISGTIIEVNLSLSETPESINDDPHNVWLFKISADNQDDYESFMTESEYADYIDEV